jgi:hypothetical protein
MLPRRRLTQAKKSTATRPFPFMRWLLSLFRSAGPVTQEALDAEVARIAREKLQPYGFDLVVCRMDDGVSRFLIKVQSTGRRYDLIKSFFHRDDGSIAQTEM